MKKMMKSKGKKLAKANYGMAVTGDKKTTVANEKKTTFAGTNTQPRWTEETINKQKAKYPYLSKKIDEAVDKQNVRDQAEADAAIARANAAKKKTTPIVTQKTGGSMYKKGGPIKKKKK